MKKMDALFEYWKDPDYIVVPAGQSDAIVEWLSQQTRETWHRVIMTWNYDYGCEVLSWVLDQQDCDKGTAARIFDVEGLGHWIWDEGLATDRDHVCSIVLKNWERYRTGEFCHHPHDRERLLEQVRIQMGRGLFTNTPILDVAQYSGSREAVSEFESEDGNIVVAFDHWVRTNGIEITE